MTEEIGTLKELNIKPGDVVECVESVWQWWTAGKHYTVGDKCDLTDDKGYAGAISPFATFRIVSRAPDTPKTWGEMTPEEKGALLLAKHEGKVIEKWYSKIGWTSYQGTICEDEAYRVRPEPKRETVRLTYDPSEDTYTVSWDKSSSCNHPLPDITFDLIDGKPNLESIRMEEI